MRPQRLNAILQLDEELHMVSAIGAVKLDEIVGAASGPETKNRVYTKIYSVK